MRGDGISTFCAHSAVPNKTRPGAPGMHNEVRHCVVGPLSPGVQLIGLHTPFLSYLAHTPVWALARTCTRTNNPSCWAPGLLQYNEVRLIGCPWSPGFLVITSTILYLHCRNSLFHVLSSCPFFDLFLRAHDWAS